MKSFENIIPRDFQGGVLVLKDGQVVFEYCQGNADHSTNTPFTSHTTITLASLSKQFVAAAIFLHQNIPDAAALNPQVHERPEIIPVRQRLTVTQVCRNDLQHGNRKSKLLIIIRSQKTKKFALCALKATRQASPHRRQRLLDRVKDRLFI